MFEEIFFPGTVGRYRAAPIPEQRVRYLIHLRDCGASRVTLRICANDQLGLVRLLKLKDGDTVRLSQIEAAASLWSRPKGRRCERSASPKARQRFIGHAVRWLRFLGWLDETDMRRHRHAAELDAYENWMHNDRGLAEETIEGYRGSARRFLDWLDANDVSLRAIKNTDIDRAIVDEKARGAYNRTSMHDYVQRLRAFFRFAEHRGWCSRGIADGIMGPRFQRGGDFPRGLKREDVIRLLATTEGQRPSDKRDRAILMLFIAYGLRASEVRGLRLDDIDWDKERLVVRCSKVGRVQIYPLSRGVGDALLSYIRDVRPSGFGRTMFFTMHAPIRPLNRSALGRMVSVRLAQLGIVTGKRGTHALRHGAAQHLLDQGLSMKVIGDFLGHRDPSSTAIYAKVNLAALREVAALDLEGLA